MKHRGIALGISKDYFLPGFDEDDVRQEAFVALWEATGLYEPEKGVFPTIARTVVHNHLRDLVQAANRLKRKAAIADWVDPPDVRDRIAARLQLLDLARVSLTERERNALHDHVAEGVPATSTKSHDCALTSARRKLRKEM
jgi:RNA polymerase sigma factor (sigma-70 family)